MKVYGFDLETNQLSPFVGEPLILTAALHGEEGSIGAMIDHPLGPGRDEAAIEKIKAILADPNNIIVGHRVVIFDLPWWEQIIGQRVEALWFDTHVAYSLIDENASKEKRNTLEALSERYVGLEKNEDDLDRKRLAREKPELVLKYNLRDAEISYETYKPLVEELEAAGYIEMLRFRMEVGRVLTDMTLAGMYLDEAWAAERGTEIAQELGAVEADLLDTIGIPDFNLRSPDQLRELLFGIYRMPVIKRSKKTQQPSTAEEVIQELRARATLPIAQQFLDKLLKYRELSKLLGTYIEPLVEKHRGIDGRVHAFFNLAGTVTGRLSSSGPNLQNIPRDKRVKGVLAASPGLRLFNADYSQLELRVAAWYSGEPLLMRAFVEGLDVHTLALAEMEGRDYEWVVRAVKEDKEWEEKRALIKQVNFGILYGVGPETLVELMRGLGIYISLKRARDIIAQWYAKYTVMVDWINATHEEIVERGFVETPTGRTRRLPNVNPDTPLGQRALRQGVNFKVQSLAGELALMALLLVDRYFKEQGGAQLLVTVHDSIVGEYHPEDWSEDELQAKLQDLMVKETLREMNARFGLDPTIPLAVDVKLGAERWA